MQVYSAKIRTLPLSKFYNFINFANFSIKFERYTYSSRYIFFISIFFILHTSENIKKKNRFFLLYKVDQALNWILILHFFSAIERRRHVTVEWVETAGLSHREKSDRVRIPRWDPLTNDRRNVNNVSRKGPVRVLVTDSFLITIIIIIVIIDVAFADRPFYPTRRFSFTRGRWPLNCRSGCDNRPPHSSVPIREIQVRVLAPFPKQKRDNDYPNTK